MKEKVMEFGITGCGWWRIVKHWIYDLWSVRLIIYIVASDGKKRNGENEWLFKKFSYKFFHLFFPYWESK